MGKQAEFESVKTIELGNCRITSIPDGGAFINAQTMYPESDPDGWKRHEDLTDSGRRVVVSLGGFLIETWDRKILIDLGYGPQTVDFPGFGPFIGGSYMESLAAAGVKPEEITDVIYTHLHVDHVGWTTMVDQNGKRQLSFPRARYLCAEAEWKYWQENPGALGPDPETVLSFLKDRIRFVGEGEQIAPGLTSYFAPGHTPGLTILRLQTGAGTVWFSSDIFHSVVQFDERDWYAVFDIDHELAAESRKKYLPEFTRENVILADAHFSNTGFGRLRQEEGRLVWYPVTSM